LTIDQNNSTKKRLPDYYNYFKNNLFRAFEMTTEEKYSAKWGSPANKFCFLKHVFGVPRLATLIFIIFLYIYAIAYFAYIHPV
jgi:hypothetical protein